MILLLIFSSLLRFFVFRALLVDDDLGGKLSRLKLTFFHHFLHVTALLTHRAQRVESIVIDSIDLRLHSCIRLMMVINTSSRAVKHLFYFF